MSPLTKVLTSPAGDTSKITLLPGWRRTGCRWRRRPGRRVTDSVAEGGDDACWRHLGDRAAAVVSDVRVAAFKGQAEGHVEPRFDEGGHGSALRRHLRDRVVEVVGGVEVAGVEGQAVGGVESVAKVVTTPFDVTLEIVLPPRLAT